MYNRMDRESNDWLINDLFINIKFIAYSIRKRLFFIFFMT